MRLRPRRPEPEPALLALRSVCHELRPPVATLTSLLRALEDQPSPERRAALAQLAAEHVSHAESVLRQAAAVARELNTLPADPAPLDEVLPVVAATAPGDRLAVGASSAARRWLVHPQHTRQILINLVGNAVRYSPGRIRLSAGLHGRRLRLTVADQGGPTPELMTAMRRQSPPPDDRGLGLWLVRQLIRTRGGTVRAVPLTPAGLVMEVRLPRYRQ
ncbi:sensor histidine kinase [Actinoplanes sp. Pm04-4]|uniref:histidine kinase n=1 Tax=Paractinoplanes pyxinae TaxID=2997416 RepID=A0ABT4AW09_9ACTN|nr:sensor histidine kinase [Actinoplanes pyxinae]MCY1137640.1 sensor histidine kinase [Actinoplanes pyxinae]